jgi:hypothetical protein
MAMNICNGKETPEYAIKENDVIQKGCEDKPFCINEP